MNRKPDVIRSLVLIFMAGLVISGFTKLGASEKADTAQPYFSSQAQEASAPAWRANAG